MKEIELKNCPNCKERIGKHDVECPYCKHVDDPKYKKYNKKLKNKKKKDKNEVYKILFLVPIIFYLIYLLFNMEFKILIITLILLNIMCLYVKRSTLLWVICIEIISMLYIFIRNIIEVKQDNILISLIIFIVGLFFVISPKIIYIIKTKKKKRMKNT